MRHNNEVVIMGWDMNFCRGIGCELANNCDRWIVREEQLTEENRTLGRKTGNAIFKYPWRIRHEQTSAL